MKEQFVESDASSVAVYVTTKTPTPKSEPGETSEVKLTSPELSVALGGVHSIATIPFSGE